MGRSGISSVEQERHSGPTSAGGSPTARDIAHQTRHRADLPSFTPALESHIAYVKQDGTCSDERFF
jgi:hypothetical protein